MIVVFACFTKTAGTAMEMTWAVGTLDEGAAAAGGVAGVADCRVKTALLENTTE